MFVVPSMFMIYMVGVLLPVVFGCYPVYPRHPQIAFCNSDRVVIGTILDTKFVPEDEEGKEARLIRYTVKIINTFKGYRSSVEGKTRYVYTPGHTALCILLLKNQQSYLLGGAKLGKGMFIRDEDLHINVESLTSKQKEYLRRGRNSYKRNCECKITMTDTALSCGIPDRSPKHDCLAKNGLCKRNGHGHCKWHNDHC